jgi:hypothetical protein
MNGVADTERMKTNRFADAVALEIDDERDTGHPRPACPAASLP